MARPPLGPFENVSFSELVRLSSNDISLQLIESRWSSRRARGSACCFGYSNSRFAPMCGEFDRICFCQRRVPISM
jgi:hypothetical protein